MKFDSGFTVLDILLLLLPKMQKRRPAWTSKSFCVILGKKVIFFPADEYEEAEKQ